MKHLPEKFVPTPPQWPQNTLQRLHAKTLPPSLSPGPRVLRKNSTRKIWRNAPLTPKYFSKAPPEEFATTPPVWTQNALQKSHQNSSAPRLPTALRKKPNRKVCRYGSPLAPESFRRTSPKKIAATPPHWTQSTLYTFYPESSPPWLPTGSRVLCKNSSPPQRPQDHFAKIIPGKIDATPPHLPQSTLQKEKILKSSQPRHPTGSRIRCKNYARKICRHASPLAPKYFAKTRQP